MCMKLADTKWKRLVCMELFFLLLTKELSFCEKRKGKIEKRKKIIIKRAYRKSFLQLNVLFNGLNIGCFGVMMLIN